jgi:predicted NBD/HSP70 family sugar kinase
MENDMKAAITSVVHQDKKLLSQDVTYLSIGMGVGSAVMFHGEIIRGSDNAFGEVGHVIIHPDGRKCDCGQRGCVQTTLTHNSLIEECQEMGVDISHVEQIFKAYRCQEKWALEFVHKTAADLSILLRNLVYMYNTNYILVGGAMILDYPELLELAQKKLENLIHSNLYSNLKIVPVKTRNNSMAGAAFIAQENCMKNIVESDLENSI